MSARRFVALDRDGTLIVERHYLADPAKVELLPGVARALILLEQAGLGRIVVTNQSAMARGILDRPTLDAIHARMIELLAAEGASVDAIYFCPHGPDDDCRCRKPRPGMLEQAARELGFEPAEAFVVGDKACDTGLGRAVGARSLLVKTGYGAALATKGEIDCDHVADDLVAAAEWIRDACLPRRRREQEKTVR